MSPQSLGVFLRMRVRYFLFFLVTLPAFVYSIPFLPNFVSNGIAVSSFLYGSTHYSAPFTAAGTGNALVKVTLTTREMLGRFLIGTSSYHR